MQKIKPHHADTGVISTEATIEKLFEESKGIEDWLKAHWNEHGSEVRKKRRRLLYVMEEINLLLDMQKIKS